MTTARGGAAEGEGLDLLAAPLRRAAPSLMRRAIEVARSADAPFGCVLADLSTGAVLVEAPNTRSSDPTGHAELNGLRRLPALGIDPAHVAVVTTAEPCPMCAAACWWAGVGAVLFGTPLAELIAMGWRQLDLPVAELLTRARPASRLVVVGGLLSVETTPLYRGGPRGARGTRGG